MSWNHQPCLLGREPNPPGGLKKGLFRVNPVLEGFLKHGLNTANLSRSTTSVTCLTKSNLL